MCLTLHCKFFLQSLTYAATVCFIQIGQAEWEMKENGRTYTRTAESCLSTVRVLFRLELAYDQVTMEKSLSLNLTLCLNNIPNGIYVYTEERGFEVPRVLYLSTGSTGDQRCWSVSRSSQRSTCFTHAVEDGSHIASLFYLRLKQTGEPRRVPRPLNLHITARELCTERDTIF